MQLLDGALVHSASDLNNYSECLHLTALNQLAATGVLTRPKVDDPTAELLARKGTEHEQRYLERLRGEFGDDLVEFADRVTPSRAAYEAAEADSVAAMARGVKIIYQATFFDGTFLGRADFLRRVERPSADWPWSYEVLDTKLALSPKPYFLVQLCNYTEHLTRVQGTAPERVGIVLGTGETRWFRVDDYAAYYRRLKRSYLESVGRGEDAYPFECSHCGLCSWAQTCERRRDEDDHLSLVAGMRRDQLEKLEAAGIRTLAALAAAVDGDKPPKMSPETFANLRAQAREQNKFRLARREGRPAAHSYTLRPHGAGIGLARLPEPAAGDVFFDIEGDPMYRPDRGLEYLWGVYLPDEDRYRAIWAKEPSEERAAFEAFVDFVVARRRQYPNLHVYHYAPYETTALKRLMGRFGSREREIDDFLRTGVFVDLYPVVHRGAWISQPSYSIKKVEALYGLRRETVTRGGDDSIVQFESWLLSRDDAILDDIRAYNEDDCKSTAALRDWLVGLRAELNATLPEDAQLPWRAAQTGEPSAEEEERSELAGRLLDGLPAPDTLEQLREWGEPDRARWLLGHLLEYHRREQKPEWWKYFARLEGTIDLVEEDDDALGGLVWCQDVERRKLGERDRTWVYTFSFPSQEHGLNAGKEPLDAKTGKGAGKIVRLDDVARRLEIKLSSALDPAELRGLLPSRPLNFKRHRECLESIARAYLDGTLDATLPATAALLLARPPRLRDRSAGASLQPPVVEPAAVSAVVGALDRSYVVVQGPPGSGKSTTAAHLVVDLLAAGKRVGLAALSHKALHNLLRKIEETATERNVTFGGCHKSSAMNDDSPYVSALDRPMVADAPKSDDFDSCDLVSATTYSWADETQRGRFDVMVVDEAGQVSLADALIASLAARDVVLLGDPQQLPQVSKGSHPVGTNLSILEHLLLGDQTIAENRGVFLDKSYRMQPQIEHFVSRAFYGGRLHADPANAGNAVAAPGGLTGGGPRWLRVEHDGNGKYSIEEADRIVAEIATLLDAGTATIRGRAPAALGPGDVLVVAPYNRQRVEITRRLLDRGLDAVGVGTVDKFQGQEAPVVFYSMAASDADLAPRGLDFLLSPNRLNVAVSRAQAVSVLVCSPELPSSRATTIDQMRLLSLLCAYIEDAVEVG